MTIISISRHTQIKTMFNQKSMPKTIQGKCPTKEVEI